MINNWKFFGRSCIQIDVLSFLNMKSFFDDQLFENNCFFPDDHETNLKIVFEILKVFFVYLCCVIFESHRHLYPSNFSMVGLVSLTKYEINILPKSNA